MEVIGLNEASLLVWNSQGHFRHGYSSREAPSRLAGPGRFGRMPKLAIQRFDRYYYQCYWQY